MAKRYYDGFYEGMDSRRSQERADGSMIKEDRSAIANLPKDVIYKEYPKGDAGNHYNLNDSLSGVDVQIKDDSSKSNPKAGKYPEKF